MWKVFNNVVLLQVRLKNRKNISSVQNYFYVFDHSVSNINGSSSRINIVLLQNVSERKYLKGSYLLGY